MAEEKAEKEYNEFNKTQKITSDFDKLLLEAKKLKNNQFYKNIDFFSIIKNNSFLLKNQHL